MIIMIFRVMWQCQCSELRYALLCTLRSNDIIFPRKWRKKKKNKNTKSHDANGKCRVVSRWCVYILWQKATHFHFSPLDSVLSYSTNSFISFVHSINNFCPVCCVRGYMLLYVLGLFGSFHRYQSLLLIIKHLLFPSENSNFLIILFAYFVIKYELSSTAIYLEKRAQIDLWCLCAVVWTYLSVYDIVHLL